MVLCWGQFSPWGHWAMLGDTFCCYNWERGVANGIEWVEARDAGKHPPMHRTAAMTKIYPTQNVNSAEAENPWITGTKVLITLLGVEPRIGMTFWSGPMEPC